MGMAWPPGSPNPASRNSDPSGVTPSSPHYMPGLCITQSPKKDPTWLSREARSFYRNLRCRTSKAAELASVPLRAAQDTQGLVWQGRRPNGGRRDTSAIYRRRPGCVSEKPGDQCWHRASARRRLRARRRPMQVGNRVVALSALGTCAASASAKPRGGQIARSISAGMPPLRRTSRAPKSSSSAKRDKSSSRSSVSDDT